MSTIYDRVYIIITNNCNLKCNFCYLNNGNGKIKSSSFGKFVEFIKNKKQIKHFVLIGGEPLLNKTNLKMFIRLIKKYQRESEIILTTNGYYLDNDIFNFLIKNKVTIQVTVYNRNVVDLLMNLKIDIKKIFFHITIDSNIKNNEEIINLFNLLKLRFWISIDRRINVDISDFLISMFINGKISLSNLRDYSVPGKKCKAIYGNQIVLNGDNIFDGCLNLISYNIKKEISKECIQCDSIFCDACVCNGIHPYKNIICAIYKKIDFFLKHY